ncbi:unnamed protein product, partial [Sphagnum compactum]
DLKYDNGTELKEKPYSFVHRMSLKSNATEFEENVKKAEISGNLDNPEGTLDALMQVLVCKEVIGWRNKSDKIVVVATDEVFHYAGDGKVCGIVIPNDGECHMSNISNSYTHWQILDYPSMHHIAEKVRENKFNVVFSVVKKVEKVYQTLVDIIGSNARVAELKPNDSKIVELIDRVYKNIRSTVKLTTEKIPDNINVKFESNCSKKMYNKTDECEFEEKPIIGFNATISMNSCPEDKSKWNQSFKIGLANTDENVEIHLEMLCECDCEKPEKSYLNSTDCSNVGTFACGICSKCNPEKSINSNDPESHCKREGDTSLCRGRGECDCGKCKCFRRFSGDFCEIDDSECYPEGQNVKCNGNDGNCIEGECKCSPEFSGKYCECPNQKCIAPNTTSVCSGNDVCICKCECEKSYKRTFCQKCLSCKYCDELISCVPEICRLFDSKKTCTKNCSQLNFKVVEQLDKKSNNSTVSCQERTRDNDCDITFIYERIDSEDDIEPAFKISKLNKICGKKVDLLIISIIVITGVILLGLTLLLIWKLITEIMDRREFVKFKRELDKANWDQ